MHTVKRNLDRPTLVDFNDWLKDKAEAHERMKTASGKTKKNENTQSSLKKPRRHSKCSPQQLRPLTKKTNPKAKSGKEPTCATCKEKHPLWRCSVFRKKTPTESAKLVADNNFASRASTIRSHSFRQSPAAAMY